MPKNKESVEVYLTRIITRGSRVIVGKLCDRLHNIRTLFSSSPEKQRRQVKETREYYLPMLVPALRKYGDEWAELADILEAKLEAALAEVEANHH